MTASNKEFMLTHFFKNVSCMKNEENHFSPIEEHFGVPWKIWVKRQANHLGLYLNCDQEKQKNEWTIDTWREGKICAVNGKKLSKTSEVTFKSTDSGTGWGWSEFVKWEEVIKDFVIDDTLRVEIRAKIKKMTGIPKKNLMSFVESRKQYSDVVLIVEDQKFYVLKLFLASQSTYFDALLLRNFEESSKSEITLSDIDANDFQNFLELIHGENPIDSTIDGIIRLADMYDAKLAIRKCEQYLIENSQKSLKEKLQLAHRYDLNNLKNHCLSKITTVADIRSVVTNDLSEMDPSVVRELMQMLLALQDK